MSLLASVNVNVNSLFCDYEIVINIDLIEILYYIFACN